jgi:hypothetical protein
MTTKEQHEMATFSPEESDLCPVCHKTRIKRPDLQTLSDDELVREALLERVNHVWLNCLLFADAAEWKQSFEIAWPQLLDMLVWCRDELKRKITQGTRYLEEGDGELMFMLAVDALVYYHGIEVLSRPLKFDETRKSMKAAGYIMHEIEESRGDATIDAYQSAKAANAEEIKRPNETDTLRPF